MYRPIRALRGSLIAMILALAAVSGLSAFTFTPMSTTIAPSGANAVMTFRVSNEADTQTAVAIRVTTRVMDAAGIESNESAEKSFLVFPARVVLAPKTAQNVKVQYRGSSTLSQELAFRVVAEQLPVDFIKSTNSGVNILIRYVAALYVAPKGVTPKVELKSAKAAEKEGKPGLEVTLQNTGTRHALLTEPVLTLKSREGGPTFDLKGDALVEIHGANVLAKSERVFFVPWDLGTANATYDGTIAAEIE